MTSTSLGHPLVRAYLEELEKSFTGLPPGQARELREQITAHLEDSLTVAASETEVGEVLRRLGRPADLAADAAEQAGSAGLGEPLVPLIRPGLVPRRRRWQAPRLQWQVSALIAAVLIGAGYLIAVETAPALQAGTSAVWRYPQDAVRTVWTLEPTGETVGSAPMRWGEQQGFLITLTNTSAWTQTIIGPVPYLVTPGGVTGVQIAVAGDNRDINRGGLTRSLTFSSPGSIPPHQTRALRVLWRTTICQLQGGSLLMHGLELRVHVGGVTRTELIPMNQYFTLSGATPPWASRICT